jgi:hypothetical protein
MQATQHPLEGKTLIMHIALAHEDVTAKLGDALRGMPILGNVVTPNPRVQNNDVTGSYRAKCTVCGKVGEIVPTSTACTKCVEKQK